MTKLDRATKIRRTVANKAYDLLKDCKEPESIYDGKYNDQFIQEYWDVDPARLEEHVAEALPEEWFEEDEAGIFKQIRTLIEVHLASQDYEDDRKRVRNEYYQYQRDQRDWNETKRGLMRL